MLAWLALVIVTTPAQADDGAPLVTVLSENPDAPFARRLAAVVRNRAELFDALSAGSARGLVAATGAAP